MSEKLVNLFEALVDDFVDIADDCITTGQINEEGFDVFIDYSIEKMREFRKSDIEVHAVQDLWSDELIDSKNEYITDFYDIIINTYQIDKNEFDSLNIST